MYDVRLAAGTKGAVLQAVATDIARALKAPNIRIVPVQAGRDTVGIEVPNATKEKVRMKELIEWGIDGIVTNLPDHAVQVRAVHVRSSD